MPNPHFYLQLQDENSKLREENAALLAKIERLTAKCEHGAGFNNKCRACQGASALGKLGGSAKSEAKKKASRENGKRGGRPKKQKL